MSLAYCSICGKKCHYTAHAPAEERLEIDGVEVVASQQHAYCDECQEEVFPVEVADFCVVHAHDAYREKIGSISVQKIQELLDLYKIGKEPLSTLLGWGPHTIAREMQHCVPNHEHAERLKSLFDPRKMKELLERNGDRVSKVAYKKAMDKVSQYLLRDAEEIGNSEGLSSWFSGRYCCVTCEDDYGVATSYYNAVVDSSNINIVSEVLEYDDEVVALDAA